MSWWKGLSARVRGLSFRTQLGTFSALAVGVTVAVAALASYLVVDHQLYSQVDSSLQSDVRTARAISPGGVIDPNQAERLIARTGGFLQVIDQTGVTSSSLNDALVIPPNKAEEAIAAAGSGTRYDTVTFQGTDYRVLTFGARDINSGTPLALQIGRPFGELEHTLSSLRLILWLVVLGGIFIAIALGYLIGRETIRPVTRLTDAAEYVAATQDLSSTIDVQSEDELGRLARSFNAMLMALAASRRQQAQLISDAGHELRTPLTSLRTNIEVLMRRPDLPEADRAELFDDVEAQLGELTTLIGDLVDLAREEERQPEPIEVRLDALVSGAVERVRRRAPGITFDTHLTAGSVRAQPALLERAVVNVLDNAVKWSPPGGHIEVWLQRGAIWALDVHDHGPGIAPEDLPHIFDRFYRAATARSLPGSGLGLAIVAQVVAQHGGVVTASCPPEGGTVVRIELPIVAEDEADAHFGPPAPPPVTADPRPDAPGDPYADAVEGDFTSHR